MRRFVGVLAVVSVLAGSAAMADPHFDGGRNGEEGSYHRDWQQDGRWAHDRDRERDHWDYGRWDHDRWDHERWEHDRWDRDHARYERGADFYRYGHYEHDWRPYGWNGYRRGDRLPVAYYSAPYVIENYRGCGLYAPPVGYRWVRVNGDAVLAAVATGIVLDAVYHAF